MSEPNTSNTMTGDSFASVLSPQLCSNTDAFLTLVRSAIYEAPSPLAAVNRYPLQSITIQKNIVKLSQHESSSARLRDKEKLNELLLFVERNASSTPSPLSANRSAFESIKQTLSQANSTAFSSVSSTASNDSLDNHTQSPPTSSSTDSLIALLPMNSSDESSEFGRSSCTMTPTLSSNEPGLGPTPSLLQRLGLASTQSVGALHRSSAEVHDAEDRVLGTAFCDKTKGSYGHGRVVREIILPDDTDSDFMVTVLDLAILVNVIHLVAPVYSLFENHCYWFVRILCDCIVIIASKCTIVHGGDPDANDELYQPPPNRPLPPGSYLPAALCGTWKGILVDQVKKEVVATVLSEFWRRRAIEMAEIQKRQDVIDEHARRKAEVGELQREAAERNEELLSLRSGMFAVQSELVTLRQKLHSLESASESELNPITEMHSSVSQI